MKVRKVGFYFGLAILVLTVLAIGFILNESKDQINATPDNVEEILSSLRSSDRLAGFAVSVFTKDSVIYTHGFGREDVDKGVPYTTDTKQFIASISKTLVGVALVKCLELGLVDLDAPINDYLTFDVTNPDFPDAHITLRQLATHTSSLIYNEEVVESLYQDDSTVEASLERFMTDYFSRGVYGAVTFGAYLPGSQWEYSNIGSALAAYIIEKRSGDTFSGFTKKHVFQPLGMSNTSWFESEVDSGQITKYYEPREDSIFQIETSGVKLYPARDLITDIEDLTTFCQAIMSHDLRLLSNEESYEVLLGKHLGSQVKNKDIDNSGLFFMIDRNQYGITYPLTGMNGGDYCINTMMQFDPVTGLGFIFIGNTGPSERNRINHIRIFRTLVSLGDHYVLNDVNRGVMDRAKFRWHNYYSRVNGLF